MDVSTIDKVLHLGSKRTVNAMQSWGRLRYLLVSIVLTVVPGGDSSLVRRGICPKRIGIGLGLRLGLELGLASNFGICTPFRTNDPSEVRTSDL